MKYNNHYQLYKVDNSVIEKRVNKNKMESHQMFLGFIAQQSKPVREHILELIKRKDLTMEQKVVLISAQLREKQSTIEENTVSTD